MPKKHTYNEGASDARASMVAKLKRESKVIVDATVIEFIKFMLQWLAKQAKRCDARPGGLGKTKAKK